MTNPNEPTLTCSEVVERLATEIEQLVRAPFKSGRDVPFELKLLAILHSWRERRVQELEKALLDIRGWAMNPGLLNGYLIIQGLAEKALAKSGVARADQEGREP